MHGLVAQGVPRADAARVAALPPVSIMFAALLGYNPVPTLLGPVVSRLPASHAAYLTGHTFFPSLISAPFSRGLAIAFYFAIAACLIAALASLLRGGKYVHGVDPAPQSVRLVGAGFRRLVRLPRLASLLRPPRFLPQAAGWLVRTARRPAVTRTSGR